MNLAVERLVLTADDDIIRILMQRERMGSLHQKIHIV